MHSPPPSSESLLNDSTVRLPKLTPRKRDPTSSNARPAPVTPALPPPLLPSNHAFTRPTRRILSSEDHQIFQRSSTHTLLVSFVFSLAESIKGTPVSAVTDEQLSPFVKAVLEILDDVGEVQKRHPPEDQGDSRFGNKGFRDFVDGLEREQSRWHQKLGIHDAAAVDELSTYFLQSFGNRTRIDYGSGHELNFMVWLLCHYQLSLISAVDLPSVVLRIFTRYLSLMRTIQSTYYLEPAGSHGVWGLDDYQFLPFLFGASQLLNHSYIRPLSIHQPLILEEYGEDYLYLGQVSFVNSVKNVEGLRWHSPMLDDISAAKSWTRVEAGMRRMFLAEVLGKLPVMQHFLFGSLVPAVEGMSTEQTARVSREEDETEGGEVVVVRDGMKHVHQQNSWGDCCGIKVPSSVGAAEEMKKRMGGEGLRRIPFD
ncbi:MAG: Serine/threonine-protein phosphatase 2A activator 2 [Piccolia ochrophora]|nr:MAG: Serine/threonine-protein phosphatase 2A activator 2 [Piccolia ochrophora]